MAKPFDFEVHGPFSIDLDEAAGWSKFRARVFWSGRKEVSLLAKQTGCYVFALRSRKGKVVPHYVGLTGSSFETEVFNRSNLTKYQKAMAEHRSHRAELFLVCHPRTKGKRNKKHIAELESFLIQAGSTVNPDIRNVKGVARYRWHIEGVTGRRPGKPPMAARAFRGAMGIVAP